MLCVHVFSLPPFGFSTITSLIMPERSIPPTSYPSQPGTTPANASTTAPGVNIAQQRQLCCYRPDNVGQCVYLGHSPSAGSQPSGSDRQASGASPGRVAQHDLLNRTPAGLAFMAAAFAAQPPKYGFDVSRGVATDLTGKELDGEQKKEYERWKGENGN